MEPLVAGDAVTCLVPDLAAGALFARDLVVGDRDGLELCVVPDDFLKFAFDREERLHLQTPKNGGKGSHDIIDIGNER